MGEVTTPRFENIFGVLRETGDDKIQYVYIPQTSLNDSVTKESLEPLFSSLLMIRLSIRELLGQTVDVISLRNSKFSFIDLAQDNKDIRYTTVLSSAVSIPDNVLKKRHSNIVNFFELFHHNLEDLKEISENDENVFLAFLVSIFGQVVPIVEQNHLYKDEYAFSIFQSLPMVDLPKGFRRHYIEADDIVSRINSVDGVLATVLFYEDKIFSTDLNPELTMGIFVRYISVVKVRGMSNVEGTIEEIPIFLKWEDIDELVELRENLPGADITKTGTVSSSQDRDRASGISTTSNEQMGESTDNYYSSGFSFLKPPGSSLDGESNDRSNFMSASSFSSSSSSTDLDSEGNFSSGSLSDENDDAFKGAFDGNSSLLVTGEPAGSRRHPILRKEMSMSQIHSHRRPRRILKRSTGGSQVFESADLPVAPEAPKAKPKEASVLFENDLYKKKFPDGQYMGLRIDSFGKFCVAVIVQLDRMRSKSVSEALNREAKNLQKISKSVDLVDEFSRAFPFAGIPVKESVTVHNPRNQNKIFELRVPGDKSKKVEGDDAVPPVEEFVGSKMLVKDICEKIRVKSHAPHRYEKDFLSIVGSAYERFAEWDDISQIFLSRGLTCESYSRRVLGQEAYFLEIYNERVRNDKKTNKAKWRIETRARNSFKRNLGTWIL